MSLGVKLLNLKPRIVVQIVNSFGRNRFASGAAMAEAVLHNSGLKEFYITLADGGDHKAVLQYDYDSGGKVIDMYHTGVPPAFRGKGVAKLLAKAALDFAVTEDKKINLTCTYLQKYVSDNPLPQYIDRINEPETLKVELLKKVNHL